MYYRSLMELQTLYQQLISCWSVLFDKRQSVYPLDNMNFSREIFRNPLNVPRLMQDLPFEPGYFSPDSSSELGSLVRILEISRLSSFAKEKARNVEKLVNDAGLGLGNGTSNVVFNLIRTLISIEKKKRPNVVIALPNYPVYYSQLLSLGIETRIIQTSEESLFLPTAHHVEEACDENTIAVLITFPNNPGQFTFHEKHGNVSELRNMVSHCQQNDVNLIVDNIYRDMVFEGHSVSSEPMLIADTLKNLFVVYGPSKDTPFLSGYRLGYWIGDRRAEEKYRELISATENCLNSVSTLAFAFYLLFTAKQFQGTTKLFKEDFEFLKNGCLGWSSIIDPLAALNLAESGQWLENFISIRNESMNIQVRTLSQVSSFLQHSEVFAPAFNGGAGNLILTGVDERYFTGTSLQLFDRLISEAKVGVLPAEVFGIDRLGDRYVPFRMTTVHDTPKNLIAGLERIEFAIKRQQRKQRILATVS